MAFNWYQQTQSERDYDRRMTAYWRSVEMEEDDNERMDRLDQERRDALSALWDAYDNGGGYGENAL